MSSPAAPWRRRCKRGLLALLALALLLGAVVATRTFLFFDGQQATVGPAAPLLVDANAAIERLAGALRLPTVSSDATAAGVVSAEPTPFAALHAYLKAQFPRAHGSLLREVVGGGSLLYTWPGVDTSLPVLLLLSHLDVVPVDAADLPRWTHPPFAGRVADGYLWGRGAMDVKVTATALLEAVEGLLSEGFRPSRTVMLAFGHDEEIGGREGAAKVAALLKTRGVQAELILDEGLTLTEGLVRGLDQPAALIGIAEKGYATLLLSARSEGGHSSMPPALTPVSRLARALTRVAERPFAAELDGVTEELVRHLGPHMGVGQRLALANLWLTRWLVAQRFAARPQTNALVRTTLAATLFQGGIKANALPGSAQATLSARIHPRDSIAKVLAHVRAAIDDPQVTVAVKTETAHEPTPPSPLDSPAYARVARAIREVFPEALVAPGLFLGFTDSYHYRAAGLSRNVYRFSPLWLRPEDTARFHGVDERVAVSHYPRMIAFYRQIIVNSQ